MPNTSPTIREPVLGDAVAVEEFLLTVEEFAGTIHPGVERENWKWTFRMESESAARSVLVALDDQQKVVAHYGIAAVKYQVRGEIVDAGVAGTLAIDTRLRTSDIFLRLTLGVLKRYRSQGMAFVMGLTNRAGLTAFHKTFGFHCLGAVSVLVKPLRYPRIAARVAPSILAPVVIPLSWLAQGMVRGLAVVFRRSPAQGLKCQEIEDPTDAIGDLAHYLKASHQIFRVRDVTSLRWRFRGTPTRTYLLRSITEDGHTIGYYVLRRMDMKGYDTLALVDVVFDFGRRDVAHAILTDVDRTARSMGCDLVAMLTNSEPLAKHLRRHGFLTSPEHFDFIVHEPLRGTTSVKASALQDWFVTWFDHDYV